MSRRLQSASCSPRFASPLRYPGGKTAFTSFLADAIRLNDLQGGHYVEPFAGGSGAALHLLFSGLVRQIHINDKDNYIYSFWRAVTEHTDEFLKLLWDSPITVTEWRRQREILRHGSDHSILQNGFATFFINRCSHSGVLNGGPIGGRDQSGEYKIDARFNRTELARRITLIGENREQIRVSNEDGIEFLKRILSGNFLNSQHALVYMDPPYFLKGHRLYRFYFEDKDHYALSNYLLGLPVQTYRWILSCDNTAIIRRLYGVRLRLVRQNYSLHKAKVGRELVISSANCILPPRFRRFSTTSSALPELNLCHGLP